MRYILLSFLLLASAMVFAQKVKRFDNNPETYLSQVTKLIRDDNRAGTDALIEAFNEVWNNDFTADQQDIIFTTSNHFIKKRIVDFESWNYYFRCLMHLMYQEEQELVLDWMNYMEIYTLKSASRMTRDQLSIYYNVFYNETLFSDNMITWKFFGGYEMKFDEAPFFEFTEVDIYATLKNDSTYIENTNGVYQPSDFKWNGSKGDMYWERTGLSRDSARAEFSNYTLFTNKSNFEADSVTLYTEVYPIEPVMGRFEERLTARSDPESATFPRFTSYRNDISIKDIAENVDFQGGLTVIGRRIYGSGTDSSSAFFAFYYEGEPKIIARGERFTLKGDIFTSDKIELTIYLDNDSIYHPKVYMRLIPDNKTVTFIRQDKGLSKSKFTNTYHKVNMSFESLNWKMDEPKMSISNTNIGTETPVVIESDFYFREERFERLRGFADRSPLYDVRSLMYAQNKNTFTMKELARELRFDERSARIFAMSLSVEGFGTFDMINDAVTFSDRVMEYINYYEEQSDYDVIAFVSQIEGAPNAMLSLLDNDLTIQGVRSIALSDSQQVRLFPYERKIVMHKDLNFDFNGAIVAGRFAFWGHNFSFLYDQFRLNMTDIDSMRFKVESFQPGVGGQKQLVDVQNVLQDLTGDILIDKPNNKSGKERHPEYPIFRSARESYVYFDNEKIFDGVYDRKEFYIELEPFEIDSLDNALTESIEFAGVFVSAGIFPDIEEAVKVQRDYSLGFVRETPGNGYPAYGGKGRFTNTISLSNKGLKGDGQLDYLTSTAYSDEFFFFPDSTNGLASRFEIEEQTAGTQYPHVTNTQTDIHWEPYNNKLYARNTDKAFEMYDDIGMTANGELVYGPDALRGNALLAYLDAESQSQNFLFQHREFSADTMSFRVRRDKHSPWAFSMENARGDVNFDRDRGLFTLNDPANYFNFEVHEYISYMDHARWDITPKTIEVKKRGEAPSSRMVSTQKDQDSLQYVAGSAKFSLIEEELEVFEANEINVADATIYPDTGYVVIDPGAKMRRLENSRVVANRTDKFHEFLESSIQISSRKKYEGTGYYEYIDEDDVGWPVFFKDIRVHRDGYSIARAEIEENDHFYLSPFFGFYGNARMEADRKFLEFDGYTLIQHECENILTDWFAFKSIIDPVKIVIDLPTPLEDGRMPINNGIYISSDSVSGYSAFLTPESPNAAYDVLTAHGKLYYDHALTSYIVASEERIADPNAKGNYLALNNRDCYTSGNGVLSFGDRLGQVKIEGIGYVEHLMEEDIIALDMQLALDFFFNDDILKSITEELLSRNELKGVNLQRDAYKTVINQLLEGKTKTKYLEELDMYGAVDKLPKELINTLTFNDIELEWVPEANAFLSVGELGIGSIGKEPINRKVDGVLEIARKRRGDEIRLYIELDNRTFYYFEYRRNLMSFYSSNDELMAIIRETKPDSRKKSGGKGQQPYTYTISTRGKMNRFLNRLDDLEE